MHAFPHPSLLIALADTLVALADIGRRTKDGIP